MKHPWQRPMEWGEKKWRCRNCGLERTPWFFFKLSRPWPWGNRCTADE